MLFITPEISHHFLNRTDAPLEGIIVTFGVGAQGQAGSRQGRAWLYL